MKLLLSPASVEQEGAPSSRNRDDYLCVWKQPLFDMYPSQLYRGTLLDSLFLTRFLPCLSVSCLTTSSDILGLTQARH